MLMLPSFLHLVLALTAVACARMSSRTYDRTSTQPSEYYKSYLHREQKQMCAHDALLCSSYGIISCNQVFGQEWMLRSNDIGEKTWPTGASPARGSLTVSLIYMIILTTCLRDLKSYCNLKSGFKFEVFKSYIVWTNKLNQ
jgi:hypothetical protein